MIENKKYKKILCWAALLFWLGFIFYMSAQPVYKSNKLSRGIAEGIVKIVEKVSPDIDVSIARLNHYLRKMAHFFCYMVLGMLTMKVLKKIGVSGKKRIIIALIVCVLYAITDEFHQLFVPGRGAQVRDVIIDGVGAVVGILMSLFLT